MEMYPRKNMMDYISEINRLFPKDPNTAVPDLPAMMSQTDMFHTPNNNNQPSMANHSSSSTDSISPDYPEQRIDSTFLNRRQRPIVGRKILGNTETASYPLSNTPVSRSYERDFDAQMFWTSEEANLYMTPNNLMEASLTPAYELFPERKDKTPLKGSPMYMPSPTNASPSSSTYSPNSRIDNTPPRYNQPSVGQTFGRSFARSPSSSFPSTTSQDVGSKMCTFCRKNGETPVVYMTHMVRGKIGNRSVVTCPILRSHVCDTCGASGDNAHTITYCPVLRSSNNGMPLQSTTITLKNTRIKSNGRRRF